MADVDKEKEGRSANDDLEDEERPAKKATSTAKPAAKTAAKPAATKPAAKAASRRVEEEDEDEDDDEEDDDEYEDEEEEEEEPPPPPPKKKVAAKSKVAAKGKALAKPVKSKAVVKRAPAPEPYQLTRVKRHPAKHYVPHAIAGMLLVGLHVFFDVPYAPVAVLGISIVIWAFMGIGSANEIKALARVLQRVVAAIRAQPDRLSTM
jgi:hypothetical protein